MNTHIKVIRHSAQRYPTCGDWYYNASSDLQIRVSKLSDGRYEQLIALHEFVEALLCDAAGVDEQAVTDFDMGFENMRRVGDTSEPGDCKDAPYYKQHQIATAIEKLIAVELGVNWQDYEKEINGLEE